MGIAAPTANEATPPIQSTLPIGDVD